MSQIKHKYKKGDYLIVTGNCKPDCIGITVQVYEVHTDDYLITIRPGEEGEWVRAWSKIKCEEGSKLNLAMNVLYANR